MTELDYIITLFEIGLEFRYRHLLNHSKLYRDFKYMQFFLDETGVSG